LKKYQTLTARRAYQARTHFELAWAAHSSNNRSAAMDVVCPDGVVAGDTITVEAAETGSFTVAVPDGVLPGETFQVELPGTAYDGYGGLGAVAKELEEAHRIVSEFSGGSLDMRDLKPGAYP
jgi:hypothetical protein